MLQPSRTQRPTARPPIEIRYIRESEPARVPTPVLALDALAKMHPATAITIILTLAGMAAGTILAIVALVATLVATVAAIVGMVAIAGLGLGVAAIMLGGRPGPPTR